MKSRSLPLSWPCLFGALLFTAPVLCAADERPLEPLPLKQAAIEVATPSRIGISGGIAGRSGEVLLFLGGTRKADDASPATWVTDGIAVAPGSDQPTLLKNLPPRADATALGTAEGLLVLGGVTPDGPTPAVTRWTVEGDRAVAEELPPLPAPLVRPAAAILQNILYVVGGAEAGAKETPLWTLDLKAPDAGWQQGPALPAGPRERAIIGVQRGGLYLMGGLKANAEGALSPTDEVWLYVPKQREGSVFTGWKKIASLPMPASAGGAWTSGQGALIVKAIDASGVSRALLFNTVTESWARMEPLGIAPDSLLFHYDARLLATEAAAAGVRVTEFSPQRTVRSLGGIDYGVIAFYFLVMAGIGAYFAPKQTSSDEFSLGNRKVRWWAAGISMFATGASSISFMSIPAMAYLTSMIWLMPLAAMVLAFFIQGWLIFPLLRRMRITSTFEYLERRFHPSLRLIASAQAVVFQTLGRTAIVLVLPAMALSATTGISVVTSVLIMGIVTTLYTAWGGFEAVIWTDVIQGLLMLATPIIVIVLAISRLPGGAAEALGVLTMHNKFELALPTWDLAAPAAWILLTGGLFQHTVQLAGDQPVVQRVFSTPLNVVRRMSATYIGCGIIIGLLVNFMGLALFAYFHRFPAQLDPASNTDQLVPLYVVTALPAGLAGLIVAAIFAASMSTISSTMNSVATLAHQDFLMRIRPKTSEKSQLLFLKVGSLVVGAIGTGLAAYMGTLNIPSMFAAANMIAGLLGGGIVGLYSLGMFSDRANTPGAIIGALTSIAATAYIGKFTDIHWAAYMPFAIIVCIVVGYVASLLTGGSRKDLTGLTIFHPAPKSALD